MPSEIKRALLGRLAIHAGLVTQQQVIECLNEQQERLRAKKKVPRLGEILYEKGYLTKEQVRALLLYRKSVTTSPPPPEKDISVIGDYEILGKFDTDATGTYYKAQSKKTKEIVTLKIMSREVMNSEGFRDRFVKESRRGASLKHPNIRRIITAGCKDNRYFYTSEYVEGSSLKLILDEKKKLSVEEAGRIIHSLVGALRHGHEKGIIHGDVCPSNILITPSGDVKLVGLGVLKDTLRNLIRLMSTADTVGFYIAPEQAVGDRIIDERADVYSLGAVYYHMLVGKPPFEGSSPLQSLIRLCEEKFTPPHEADKSVPRAVSDIIIKMIHAEPSHRQRTMAEVGKDLDSAGVGSSPEQAAVEAEQAAPVKTEQAAPANAEEMLVHQEPRHRATERYRAQPVISQSTIAIITGLSFALVIIVLVILMSSFKSEEKTHVSSPAPVEVSEEGPSREEVTGRAAEAKDQEEEEPARVAKPEPRPRPKPKPKPVTEEDVAFGRGGSLFAPPGWKTRKSDAADEARDQEEKEPEKKKPEKKKPEPKPRPKPTTKQDAAFGRGGSLFAPPGWKPAKPEEEEKKEKEEKEE